MCRSILVAACSLLIFPVAVLAQSAEPHVAVVFGSGIHCRDLQAFEPRNCALALLRRVHAQVARRFIERNSLNATESELFRLIEHNLAFEQHDRAQRSRKLAELEARLASARLPETERERLEGFRDVLTRLARYEADVDAGIEVREPIADDILRNWIEAAKLNSALYSRYGGIVGVTAHGPYAHGALTTLIAEHVSRGDVQLLDATIAGYFHAAMQAAPRMVHTQGKPDFTPFWERSIVPSYVPD